MGRMLDGKVAVITGGAAGMGLSTVEMFVEQGAKVVFCDLPAESKKELAARIGAENVSVHHSGRLKGGPNDGFAIAERLGASAHFVPADVADRAQLTAVVDAAVKRFGGLDIMFNNAGIATAEGKLVECSDVVFDRMLAVDLKAVWMGMQIAAPHLIARGGGSIISTSSLAALGGIPGLAAYTAAKAGVVGITRTIASELGPHNIRVNCICPGAIMTTIPKAMFGEDFDLDAYRRRMNEFPTQPIPRAGDGDDIAGTALWLASDYSRFVTGQIIAVDGGASTHSWLNVGTDTDRFTSRDFSNQGN